MTWRYTSGIDHSLEIPAAFTQSTPIEVSGLVERRLTAICVRKSTNSEMPVAAAGVVLQRNLVFRPCYLHDNVNVNDNHLGIESTIAWCASVTQEPRLDLYFHSSQLVCCFCQLPRYYTFP